ncbi:hypothetical protein Taro_010622 [Colocasia esculenta]|uniref:Uncharacterized protein n=1 Tax=Colocasia esculenta TaxID=4460 RepID=A0A843U8V5_COLES|nr:hypothetical protein [Colocasia esculenta]
MSDSDNRAKSYSRLSEGVSVCDRIGSPRLHFRRGIWAPDRKSLNVTHIHDRALVSRNSVPQPKYPPRAFDDLPDSNVD